MAAFILAFIQEKVCRVIMYVQKADDPVSPATWENNAGLHESSTWAPRAAVIFLPEQVTVQRSSGCESQRCPHTQPPGASTAQQLDLPAEAWLSKHRAEQQGRSCSQCTQPPAFKH